MNVNGVIDERLDPIASARGAARYLSHAYDTLGSWPLALTSYNHGIGGMQRAKGYFGHDFMRIVREYDHPLFGFASRNFYAEFLAAREVADQPERFFPEGVSYEPPLLDGDRVMLARNAPVPPFSRDSKTDRRQLIAMNAARAEPIKAKRRVTTAGREIRQASRTARRITRQQEVSHLAKAKVESRNASRSSQAYRPKDRVTADTRPRDSRVGSKYKVNRVQVASRK
jgi:membrane-bound lytic murein transglycosylase D